ncbi:cytochrome P450 [Streptomyces sp. 2333.5]|uniref:cytochrome P450 n=1 Tax=unclassified Streptomyces TaxID=2593676 RepID=UPI00089B8136|nr:MULTISPECIES: cytochrome P450 [unclassified Streptomyces]PJI99967.1 cytochrome P450 [Streptomyces sp. 2333.5]SEB66766.1 Cytochrome P450 [Streptomyces sp. 2314.4]SEC52700.1 Cytochrome P450 [Streptomyces sp. 2112.2]
MAADTLFQRITDYAHRADPYPLYAELRENGVARQDDGSYLVGTYHEIAALLHDPRISSDRRHRTAPDETAGAEEALPPSFIGLDDPEHHRLRGLAMRSFGPPHTPDRIDGMHEEITRIVQDLIADFQGKERIDVVDDFAYPLPVTVICRLLGVPTEDESRFRLWSDAIVAGFDPTPGEDPVERQRAGTEARKAMGLYLGELAERRRGHPSDDMLSAFVNDAGPGGQLTPLETMTTAVLLLIAGHETTVNLITNGMLTLLRHPDALERLRSEPALMPLAVEELLRFEPPVQMLPQRTPLADVEVAGITVPRGSPLILMLASGNRDPRRFSDPDRFDPAREDNQHLGFGSGVHSCFGAPLARLETQIALHELLQHLDTPRLVEDPPEYRRSPVLRGPRHLFIERGGV